MGNEADYVKELVASNPVAVFSKSYCPHCKRTKALLTSIGAKFHVVEMDQVDNGSAIQDALAEITGQRSVPNVFIGGSPIGGADDTAKLHEAGELVTKLGGAGAI